MNRFQNMTAAEYQAMIKAESSKNPINKFHAIRTEIDGIKFASSFEAERYCQLQLLERSGKILNLMTHVSFVIIPESQYGDDIKYIADFVYMENGERIVEDTKSPVTKTPIYVLKRRLMAEQHGIIIREIEK